MTCPHCHAALGVDARFCPVCGKALASTETQAESSGQLEANLVGKEIAGRFRILAKIGQGGMGAVYRGEQISLKRAVAVKLLRPDLLQNPTLLRRFSAEAEAVAKLDHPNTVKVYDFGQDTDGALFIAMEYVEGGSLRAAMTNGGPMPPARALVIAIQVAASLADAHAQRIVHRDLKPDNVMLQDKGRQRDIVRVLDFGIAKLRDDQRSTQAAMTQAGDMLGTPQYMAPEQIRGDAIDGRTDVYALGCMLYEMLTGRLPFEGTSVLAILTKHLTDVVVPPSQRRPDLGLPRVIDQVVMSAMAKEVAARPATMERYGEMLVGALQAIDPRQTSAIPQATPAAPFAVAAPPPSIVKHVPAPIPPTIRSHPAPPAYTPPPGYTAPPRRNWIPWIAALGAVGLVAAGVGIYLSTKKSAPTGTNLANDTTITPSSTATTPGPDPWDVPGTPLPPMPEPPPVEPTPQPAPAPRPAPPRPAPAADTSTAMIPIPAGAHINPPDGFTMMASSDRGQAYQKDSIVIALAPLDAGTNDPEQIAQSWSKMTGLTDHHQLNESVLGKKRAVLGFKGTIKDVEVMQVIVLFIEPPKYRLGFLVQVPVAIVNDKATEQLVNNLLANGVTLP